MRGRALRAAVRAACALAAVCCLAHDARAQAGGRQPRPVRFEQGRTTAVLKGAADNANGVTYAFAAKAGQTMSVHLTSRGGAAVFSVTEPGGPLGGALEVKDWSGPLPSTGTYLLAVWSRRKGGRAVPYAVELTIR